ncbi:MazG-like family protein [Streptomyces sp. NBC_00344]|uniref:MazG-like family protein n=1 Tax=Streptomyces sp. NBC_00344 TaxID=2975720 RepID=UPI002E24C9A1
MTRSCHGRSTWTTIGRLHTWLGEATACPPGEATLFRILKLSEEVGEVAQAVIGATGQNPRKGVTHTWQEVEGELCDVIVSAMVALRTLTPDASDVFAAHLRRVEERSLQVSAKAAGQPYEAVKEPRE